MINLEIVKFFLKKIIERFLQNREIFRRGKSRTKMITKAPERRLKQSPSFLHEVSNGIIPL